MNGLASASLDTDIVVVGAGVAGLAATRMLRAGGKRVELLEAGPRIGGRAFTDTPAAVGYQPFDHGAQWLHAAHRNALVTLAQARNEAVHPDTPWDERLCLQDGAHPGDRTAYEAAEARWTAAVTSRLGQADSSLSEAGKAVAGDPWTATIESFEGAIIAAADADDLSLADWHANALDGENYVAAGGLGALVRRLLATPARLGVRVTGIGAEPGGVRVETSAGALRASAAIVTVSTGVLRAEAIGFSPALPGDILAALDGLPMGLLTKIALRAASPQRLGLQAGTNVIRRLEQRGAAFLSPIFWQGGTDLAVSFLGGRAAWALAHRPDEAAAFMREAVAEMFGARAKQLWAPAHLVTAWAEDPLFRGAYAYARPGCAGARAVLAKPVWDGRLVFAGEACAIDGLAGTVAGAYESGRKASSSFL